MAGADDTFSAHHRNREFFQP